MCIVQQNVSSLGAVGTHPCVDKTVKNLEGTFPPPTPNPPTRTKISQFHAVFREIRQKRVLGPIPPQGVGFPPYREYLIRPAIFHKAVLLYDENDLSSTLFPSTTFKDRYILQEARNFCRNPGGEEDTPWCYTQDTTKRWEVCDIPFCGRTSNTVLRPEISHT